MYPSSANRDRFSASACSVTHWRALALFDLNTASNFDPDSSALLEELTM